MGGSGALGQEGSAKLGSIGEGGDHYQTRSDVLKLKVVEVDEGALGVAGNSSPESVAASGGSV